MLMLRLRLKINRIIVPVLRTRKTAAVHEMAERNSPSRNADERRDRKSLISRLDSIVDVPLYLSPSNFRLSVILLIFFVVSRRLLFSRLMYQVVGAFPVGLKRFR